MIYLQHVAFLEYRQIDIYYALRNDEWGAELTLYSGYAWVIDNSRAFDEMVFLVNDEEVNEQVYATAPLTELGITDNRHEIVGDPATVHAVLAELQSRIAVLEAALANPQTIPNAHLGPSPYSIIPDPSGSSDGFIGEWNSDTERYEITGRPEDVTDQVMFMDAPFELFHSFYINGVMQERDVHYTVEEGSTRVTILAQTIQDLDNGDHTAEAAFSREDGSGLLDIVAQDFTVNLTRSANPGGGGSGGTGSGEGNESGGRENLEYGDSNGSGSMLPIIIGVAIVLFAGGGAVMFVMRKRTAAKRYQEARQVFLRQTPVLGYVVENHDAGLQSPVLNQAIQIQPPMPNQATQIQPPMPNQAAQMQPPMPNQATQMQPPMSYQALQHHPPMMAQSVVSYSPTSPQQSAPAAYIAPIQQSGNIAQYAFCPNCGARLQQQANYCPNCEQDIG